MDVVTAGDQLEMEVDAVGEQGGSGEYSLQCSTMAELYIGEPVALVEIGGICHSRAQEPGDSRADGGSNWRQGICQRRCGRGREFIGDGGGCGRGARGRWGGCPAAWKDGGSGVDAAAS